MDEKQSDIKTGDSLPIEDNVYRMVHTSKRSRKNNMIPHLDAFIPNPADQNKLSVDYDKLTTPEESLARFGATFRHNSTEFKNHVDFSVFTLEISYLKALPFISDITLDPVIVSPPQKGKPQNIAHSLVHFSEISSEDEPEVLSKLHEYAKLREVQANDQIVNTLVEQYRKQWD